MEYQPWGEQMDFDLESLRSYFGMHKKETAGFMLMLLHMEKGDKFSSRLGVIQKTDDMVFQLTTNKTVGALSKLWMDEIKNPIEALFE
jgi:hypothetical protein